jgi:hypothetical protein
MRPEPQIEESGDRRSARDNALLCYSLKGAFKAACKVGSCRIGPYRRLHLQSE